MKAKSYYELSITIQEDLSEKESRDQDDVIKWLDQCHISEDGDKVMILLYTCLILLRYGQVI